MREATRDSDRITRLAAAAALGGITGDSQEALLVLLDGVESTKREDYMRCYHTINLLGAFGPDAAPAIPVLKRLLRRHPRSAAAALAQIGSQADTALADLRKLLNHQDPWARRNAAEAIRKIKADVERRNKSDVGKQ